MNTDALTTALQQNELFNSLAVDDLAILLENGEVKQYSRGKILYRKGEKSNDTFCFLVSGAVNIVAKNGQIVRELGVNEVIGEVALSDPNQVRTVTVITKEPCEVIEWNVWHIKDKIPILWKKLLKLAWKHITLHYED